MQLTNSILEMLKIDLREFPQLQHFQLGCTSIKKDITRLFLYLNKQNQLKTLNLKDLISDAYGYKDIARLNQFLQSKEIELARFCSDPLDHNLNPESDNCINLHDYACFQRLASTLGIDISSCFSDLLMKGQSQFYFKPIKDNVDITLGARECSFANNKVLMKRLMKRFFAGK